MRSEFTFLVPSITEVASDEWQLPEAGTGVRQTGTGPNEVIPYLSVISIDRVIAMDRSG